MKYSDKQRFCRYKTKTEPKLFSKIMIDEEAGVSSSLVATRGCLTLTPPQKTTGRVAPDLKLKLTIILNVLFIYFIHLNRKR